MKTHEFSSSMWLPRLVDEVFPFFSEARNLEQLTPPWLRFEILTPEPIPMKVGTLIDYRLRLRGIPIRWRSRIAAWEPPNRFIDQQIKGPYRYWHHEDRFVDRDGGTQVSDHVRYAVWGGTLVDRIFVRNDVIAIFDYRKERLRKLFDRNI